MRILSRGRPVTRGLRAAGVAAMVSAAAPALALMPPYVYETARNEAPNVVIVAVDDVKVTPREFGTCDVGGTVKVVERGDTFRVGQPMRLAVPCARPDASPPIGGIIYQVTEKLTGAKFGRAYLDDNGKILASQYYPLDSLP